MQWINFEALNVAEHIAMDALALECAEAGQRGESLRLWESVSYFVVLGRGGQVDLECDRVRCEADGVPIIRRVSGGGTVLQGPGCLNFSMVLRLDRDPLFGKIDTCYAALLEKFAQALRTRGVAAQLLPLCDLVVDGQKFSGNAQARKRSYFLHHGTLLYDFDLEKISTYLRHPPKEPQYREGRSHDSFVTNLKLSRQVLSEMVQDLFPADEPVWKPGSDDRTRIEELVDEKFANKTWNFSR